MPASRVVIVFVDALGPALAMQLAEHLRTPMTARGLRGVLGYSTGALPTVLTGAPPNVHGRMCLFTRAGGAERLLAPLRWLGLLPRLLHERRRVRAAVERLLRWRHGLDGYLALHRVPPRAFSWLDIPEREDLFAADTIGGATTFLADARRAGLSVYAAPWQLRESERWAASDAALAAAAPSLTFLYATELDGVMHAEGTRAQRLDERMARLAVHIDRARDRLSAGGAVVTTLVVGDHGMADVTRTVDPRPVLARAKVTHAFVDSTMVRAWGPAAELAQLRRAFEDDGAPGRWLDPAALATRAVPEHQADGLWLLPEGALFAPSFLGGAVRGMHGYDLDQPSAQAGLLSDDPAILAATRSLTDVATVVRARLSLPDTRRP